MRMSAAQSKWFVGLAVAWSTIAAPLTASGTEMQVTVSVPHADAEGGVARNRLRLGMIPSASNVFDPALDLEALPSPALSAAVRHPEYATAYQFLWWDFREEAFPQIWEMEISSDQRNATMTISAEAPPTVPNGCSQGRWTLRDTQTGETFDLGSSPLTYAYPNSVGVTRRFVVRADELAGTIPPVPQNLWSPRQGRASVYLAWSDSSITDARYHVYRQTDQGTVRLTTIPIDGSSYVVTGVDRSAAVTYQVTAVSASGCESAYSVPLTLPAHQ